MKREYSKPDVEIVMIANNVELLTSSTEIDILGDYEGNNVEDLSRSFEDDFLMSLI